jgi:hypothetical protein
MLLQFATLDRLALLLKAGLLPPEVAAAPAQAWQADGLWNVVVAGPPGRPLVAVLKAWEVAASAKAPRAPGDARPVRCLAELIPPVRERGAVQVTDRQAVLFWLRDERRLAPLVQEVLRQSNDRIALRSLADTDGGAQHLVRVVGAPYYTLLQAIEGRADDSLQAFVERTPRVWVESGYAHPLAAELRPAAHEWLFIRGNGQWQTIPEAPFRDLYSSLELSVPAQPVSLQETAPPKLAVPLRLVRGGGYETPDLWVITQRAVEQLDAFVQASSDQTLARLAFAVIESGDQPTVLIRVRPGKGAPVELVFEGLACRSFLRLTNLYVPVGQRLHPPLRRDAIKDLLAGDVTELTWLTPQEDGSFTPHTVREAAFRPLSEWVEYVVDRDSEAMTAWTRSMTFAFDSFVCRDDVNAALAREERQPKKAKTPAEGSAAPTTTGTAAQPATGKNAKLAAPSATPPLPFEPSQLEVRLQQLEKEFTSLTTPLDDPARTTIWENLAVTNALLERHAEATQCFAHVLWENETGEHWAAVEEWLFVETKASSLAWTAALRDPGTKRAAGALERLVEGERALAQHGQLLAATLTAARQSGEATIEPQLLMKVQQYLERVEPLMSARTAWLAWIALYEQSGDELMLARARDRALHRLHQHGLMADVEVPIFLRGVGGNSDRYRAVREELLHLQTLVRSWSDRNRGLSSLHTHDYVDLMFSFALARLGEGGRARDLVEKAVGRLAVVDPVHRWLARAFEYRITQVLEGNAPTGAWPESMLADLENIERLDRYKVDRLRQHSRILEPHEALDPYRDWRKHDADSIEQELARLASVFDRKELEQRLRALLTRATTPDAQADVLIAALELAWRSDDKFAADLLRRLPATLDPHLAPGKQFALLEKGLHAVGHFDLREMAPPLLLQLSQRIAAAPGDKATFEALDRALAKSFQGLRKLGMRDELAALLASASEGLRTTLASAEAEPHQLRVLLALAGAGLALGQQDGWKDVDRAREKLLTDDVGEEGHVAAAHQTLLAVSYLHAVGQAPLTQALGRFREFFELTSGIRDHALTVTSHYSLKQLDVVESLIQTITNDQFTMDRSAKAWLDDEEFLIRRRIHRDVRQALEQKRG